MNTLLHLRFLILIFLVFNCGLKDSNIDKPVESPDDNTGSWLFKSQRKEIAPAHCIDAEITYNGSPTLVLAGGGKSYSNGHWYRYEDVEPGKYYRFKVYFRERNVDEPNRCILARILWFDVDDKQVVRAEYPGVSRDSIAGWQMIEKVCLVPDGATKARFELIYRWDEDGIVNFGGMSFTKVPKPEPRNVRLATVHYRPENGKSPQDNLDQFVQYIQDAADKNADIVCLPEAITKVGTHMDYITASESVPGPSTDFLGKLAVRYNLYIVAGILERDGPVVYNTAVLLDRQGNLAGKYRKTSLPREEINGGITPGDALPVFDTDFGRIGMLICWDSTFPEQARTLAQKGAEVIFLPIAGGFLTLVRARAIENQVYIVSSSYDMKSAVFDLEGIIMDEATDENRVVVVEVDLNEQKLWPWVGNLKNRIPREMPTREALRVE